MSGNGREKEGQRVEAAGVSSHCFGWTLNGLKKVESHIIIAINVNVVSGWNRRIVSLKPDSPPRARGGEWEQAEPL